VPEGDSEGFVGPYSLRSYLQPCWRARQDLPTGQRLELGIQARLIRLLPTGGQRAAIGSPTSATLGTLRHFLAPPSISSAASSRTFSRDTSPPQSGYLISSEYP
jgi:hypothetical protein